MRRVGQMHEIGSLALSSNDGCHQLGIPSDIETMNRKTVFGGCLFDPLCSIVCVVENSFEVAPRSPNGRDRKHTPVIQARQASARSLRSLQLGNIRLEKLVGTKIRKVVMDPNRADPHRVEYAGADGLTKTSQSRNKVLSNSLAIRASGIFSSPTNSASETRAISIEHRSPSIVPHGREREVQNLVCLPPDRDRHNGPRMRRFDLVYDIPPLGDSFTFELTG